MGGKHFRTLMEQFEHSYIPEPNSGCWLWWGALTTTGYAKILPIGTRRPVAGHRVAWELFNGPIPAGLSVLHRCDVATCVNPGHLFLGTHLENMADMKAKGRTGNWTKSRFKPSQRADLMRDCLTMKTRELSEKYGVDPRTVRTYRARALIVPQEAVK